MLDGGPSRKSQATEQRAGMRLHSSRRHEETAYPAAEPQPVAAVPAAPVARSRARHQGRPRSWNGWVVAAAILVVVAVIGWAVWDKTRLVGDAAIEKDKYQAVFMAGGQVYFGKLEILDAANMKLSQVFYIQSDSNGTEGDGEDPQTTNADGGMRLIKLGEEVHGPEDAMIINRDQMLFYENLKPSGRVSQLIQNYKSGNQ